MKTKTKIKKSKKVEKIVEEKEESKETSIIGEEVRIIGIQHPFVGERAILTYGPVKCNDGVFVCEARLKANKRITWVDLEEMELIIRK